MEELNNITVIRKNDPAFPSPQFNFEELRRLGLEHIGELSGKIWTDHNVHDPGVTILEMLCYALFDLGYRTKLPIQDILALNQAEGQEEDNFFTPAQILTSNPSTILDYRKMLIDIEGVQNAWLEVAAEDEITPSLFVNSGEHSSELQCGVGEFPVPLNGLYKVYLQLGRQAPYCNNGKSAKSDRNAIVREAKERLLNHRNLCEDFIDIRILGEEEIGIEADIELDRSANPEKAYVEAMKRLKEFFNPEVEFFTLQELLDKGRSIEEAFEGRPYSTESFGFIDTGQLEKITLPKEIHLSDIYSMLLDIEGVNSVRGIKLKAFVNGREHIMEAGANCFGYIHHLAENHAPVFCIDRSNLTLFQDSSVFRLDPFQLERLLKQAFGTQRSARYSDPTLLDNPAPLGNYRSGLEEYDSIQNEFPRVYGIGEDGLGEDVTDERKAQALQLKAYLLFYDQLLAAYLSQLANIRTLFSMSPDSTRQQQHTYFSQRLDSVTRVEDLIRFYDKQEDGENNPEEGAPLAYPVELEAYREAVKAVEEDPDEALVVPPLQADALIQREAMIEQLQREFQQGESLKVEAKEEECGFFYLIMVATLDFGLLSKQRYKTRQEALLAAESAIFMGTLPGAYQMDNDMAQGLFSFEVLFRQVDYLEFLNGMMESEPAYLQRRNAFLDHMLARFSESFTDYSLLLYEATEAEKAENKARLLSQYDELSRNRGRAFNYCEESWNTDNVSGLEKRVATLGGLPDFKRTALCNFEVGQRKLEYTFALRGFRRDVWLICNDRYYSSDSAHEAALSIAEALRHQENYQAEDNPSESQYNILIGDGFHYAAHPMSFREPALRDRVLLALSAPFRDRAFAEDIFVHEYRYLLRLETLGRREVERTVTAAPNQAQADAFINSIITIPSADGSQQPALLEALPGQQQLFLDTKGVEAHFQASAPRYRWQFLNPATQAILQSTDTYASESEARDGFLEAVRNYRKGLKTRALEEERGSILCLEEKKGRRIAEGIFQDAKQRQAALEEVMAYFEGEARQEKYLQQGRQGYSWQVQSEQGDVLLESSRCYREEGRARNAWLSLHSMASKRDNFNIEATSQDKACVTFRDSQKSLLARSPEFINRPKRKAKEWIDNIQACFAEQARVSFPGVENLFGFQVPGTDPGEGLLLESYCLYASRKEAWESLQELKKHTGRKRNYFPTGDSGNLQFSFLVQRRKGDFIAFHPNTYQTDKAREKKQEQARGALRQFRLPLQVNPEFSFLVIGANREALMESIAVFDSEEAARLAFQNNIKLATDSGNLFEARNKKSRAYRLELRDGDVPVAASPLEYPDKKGVKQARSDLSTMMEGHLYQLTSTQIPYQYKFRFWWQLGNGEVEVLLESPDPSFEGTNAEGEARQGYSSLILAIRAGKVRFEETGLSFYHTDSGDKVGQRPEGSRELSTGEAEDIDELFSYMQHFGGETHSAIEPYIELSEIPPPETGFLSRDFVYRAYEKGLPLAFHPCQCLEKTGTTGEESLTETLFSRGRYGYEYLEVCLAGDITCKIDKKFHYIIRDKSAFYEEGGEKTGEEPRRVQIPYFISYKGYETEQEALDAFQQEYLEVIMLASCIDNYCFAEEQGLTGTGESGMETGWLETGWPETGAEPCTGRIWAYEPPETEEEEGGCSSATDPLVYIPAATFAHFDESGQGGIEEVIRRFTTYPVRRMLVRDKEDPTAERQWKYFFQIAGNQGATRGESCAMGWASTHCYDSTSESWEGLRHFEYLLANAVNYRVVTDEEGVLRQRVQGKCPDWEVLPAESCSTQEQAETGETGMEDSCCRFIGLSETLIESNCHYEAKEDAWGTSLMVSSEGWDTIDEACTQMETFIRACSGMGQDGFSDASLQRVIERHGSYYLLLDIGGLELESAKGFDTQDEAIWYGDGILGLLMARCGIPEYYRIQMGEGCRYHFAIAGYWDETLEKAALESCLKVPKDPNVPWYCENEAEAIRRKRGLERFLEVACHSEAYIPYSIYVEGSLGFSFQIVDKDYHLARHPYQYSTVEERDARLQELCTCPDSQCKDLIPALWAPEEAGEACHYVIRCEAQPPAATSTEFINIQSPPVVLQLETVSPNSGITWISYDTYCDCDGSEATRQALNDFLFEVIPYAREERFYYHYEGRVYLCRRPYDPDQSEADNFEASKAEGAILAYLETGTGWFMPEELARIAQNYPIVKRGGKYGFQLYCEDFSHTGLTDEAPCDICPPEEETGTGWETGTGALEAGGAVVWESVQLYPDLATAKCYYGRFCQLIGENSIDLTGEEGCGPFSMQVVDPRAVLAGHPQFYKLKAERERAIERTRASVGIEGFHLVEHILLRPGRVCSDGTGTDNCNCLIPTNPDTSCPLEYQRSEDDPCAQGPETGTGKDPCQEDEGFFEKYIPGSDPYSFWATVILPNWPARFRKHDFREAFQNLLRREAPAHVALNIIWVGPEDLCRFESRYQQWLRWLAGKDECIEEGADCALVRQLFRMHYCPDISDTANQPGPALANVSSMNICNLFHTDHSHEASSPVMRETAGNVAVLQFKGPRLPASSTVEVKMVETELLSGPAPMAEEEVGRTKGLAVEKKKTEAPNKEEAPVKKKKAPKAKKAPEKKKAAPKKKTTAPKAPGGPKRTPSARSAPKPSPPPEETKAADQPKPLSTSEKRRLARRRVAGYRTVVEAGTDSKVKSTRVYEETMKFFDKAADLDAFITAIDYNNQYGLRRKKTKAEKAPYVLMLQNVIWRFLDQQVSENPETVQKESVLKETFGKLRAEKINMKQLAEGWKGEELKEWTGASVIDEYLKLM